LLDKGVEAASEGQSFRQLTQRLFWTYCMRASLLSMRRIMVR